MNIFNSTFRTVVHSFIQVRDLTPRCVLSLILSAGDTVGNRTKCHPQFANILVEWGRQNANTQLIT